MNLNGNKKDYLNRTKIWGIEDQGANYVPLNNVQPFFDNCFYGTEICHEASQ